MSLRIQIYRNTTIPPHQAEVIMDEISFHYIQMNTRYDKKKTKIWMSNFSNK